MATIKLFDVDCCEVRLNERVNCIITDPPYNIGIKYNTHDDRMSEDEYAKFTNRWLCNSWLWTLDDASMWVVINWDNYALIRGMASRLGWQYKNTILWHETFSQYSEHNYTQVCRPILYFVKDKKNHTWKPLRETSVRQLMGDTRANPDGKVLTTLWTISRVCGTFGERVFGVPTQLPLELCDRMVLTSTVQGDTILDPFAGSGSVGVSAKRHNRNFIGIEKDAHYIEIIKERLTLGQDVV